MLNNEQEFSRSPWLASIVHPPITIKYNYGFTLFELVVVMIIIAIMAAFTIPNFTKAFERSKARDGCNGIKMIYQAQALYKAQNGSYYLAANLTALNTNLGLSVKPGDYDYSCVDNDPATPRYTCIWGVATNKITVDLDNALKDSNPNINPVTVGEAAGLCP